MLRPTKSSSKRPLSVWKEVHVYTPQNFPNTQTLKHSNTLNFPQIVPVGGTKGGQLRVFGCLNVWVLGEICGVCMCTSFQTPKGLLLEDLWVSTFCKKRTTLRNIRKILTVPLSSTNRSNQHPTSPASRSRGSREGKLGRTPYNFANVPECCALFAKS